MNLKLLRNMMAPWGGGFEGEIVHSPPIPAEVAQELVRRGYAQELPEPPSPAAAAPLAEKVEDKTKGS